MQVSENIVLHRGTTRDLLAQVRSEFGGATISQYDYENDALGRRTEIARSGTAMSETRADAYGYNDRNELVSAAKTGGPGVVPADEYAYQYDDIGNRLSSFDLGTNHTYTANNLNQYTQISNLCDSASLGTRFARLGRFPMGRAHPQGADTREEFIPQYDLDGNQTLVKTSTGIWSVTYNGENRPVSWTCGPTNVVMSFDRMGRRVSYLETVSGGSQSPATVTNGNYNFVYDGYLCIQRIHGATKNVKLIFTWDPLEKVATKPLMIEKPGSYKMHVTHDGNKNVSELVFFSGGSGIAAHYEYAPFGAETVSTRNTSVTAYDFRTYNPFRFSSEYADDELGLVYYNYRHYEPVMGRWLSRDPIGHRRNTSSLFCFTLNSPICAFDKLGLRSGNMKAVVKTIIIGKIYWPGEAIRYDDFPEETFAEILNKDSECIASLLVVSHGNKEGEMVMMQDSVDATRSEDARNFEISSMFDGVCFCNPCFLEIRSCYLGASDFLKQRLSDKTGCVITLYSEPIDTNGIMRDVEDFDDNDVVNPIIDIMAAICLWFESLLRKGAILL